MRFTLFILLFMASKSIHAQDPNCVDGSIFKMKPLMDVARAIEGDCPKDKKLPVFLCMAVTKKISDSEMGGRYMWKYQKRLFDAACVDPKKDSEEVIARKISKMWKENEGTLICNNTSFDVPNGNVIKLAVSLQFDEFLIDMAKWDVNLNKVDPTDGRTVLDYIQYQLKLNQGSKAITNSLEDYYQSLRSAGAKHKSEL